MKNILKIFITVIIGLFAFISSLNAALITVDLSVNLTIEDISGLPTGVVEAGQPYTNTITITNNNPAGGVSAAGSKITYTLPTGTSYNNGTSGTGWSCIHDTTTVQCSYGLTLTGGVTSNPLILLINSPDTGGTTLNSNVQVALSDSYDPVPGNNQANDSITTGKSNLTATKTASKSPLAYNETFSYTIVVSNPTSGVTVPARGVTISDPLPPGFELTNITTTGGLVCNESTTNTLTCDAIDFAIDETKTVIIDAVASPSTADLTNTATITAASSDYNAPLNPSVTVEVQLADIGITQSITTGVIAATNKVAVDSDVTYQYIVENHGATTAEDVAISVEIPSGSSLVSTSGAWTCAVASPIGNTVSPLNCTLNDSNLTGSATSSLDVTLKMPSTIATLDNNATAYTSSAENNVYANSTSIITTNVVGADLDIVKTQNSTNADIGSNHTYTITVTNNGLVDANNVYIVDTLDLDDNMTYVSDTSGGKCSLNGTTKTLTCNIGTIVANPGSYSFDVTVKMPTDSDNDVTNTVDVNTTTGQDNSNNLSDSIDTEITRANLSITKDANVTNVGIGKPFSYTLQVTNSRSAYAIDATITDTLPDGVTVTSITDDGYGWSCDTLPIAGIATLTCTLDNFPGNGDSTLTLLATAPNVSGPITNNAIIGHSLKINDDDDSKTITVDGVTLGITKSASPTAIVGGLIDYNVTVTNTSISDANQTTITDGISAFNGTYVFDATSLPSGDWDCSTSTTTNLTCTKSTLLLAGESETINFKVKVPIDAPLGTIKNKAIVDTTSDSNTPITSNETSTIIKGASLVLTQIGDTSGIANAPIAFAVKVLNDGTATARDVNVTLDLNTNSAANFTSIYTDCGTGTYNLVTEPFVCTLGDIASGASQTINIRAIAPNYDSVNSGANIQNSAQAVTSTPQETTNTDHVNWDVSISGADLYVQKTPSSSEVAVGGTVTYTIALTNQGDANATGITLSDTVLGTTPLVLSNLVVNASDWNCTTSFPSSFDCTYQHTLIKDATTSSITIDATAPLDVNIINTDLNNEVIVATPIAERDDGNTNKSTSPVTVRGADLNITKTVDKPIVSLGEQVVFTINVENTDLADAQDVNVTDPIPAGFTYVSTTCTNETITELNFLCELGTIASGASKSFTITADAPNTDDSFNNIATTVTSTPELDTSNNDDNATVTVQGADLVITKRDSADPVAVNSLYNYTIHLTNDGRSSAFGADINDTISGQGWTYVQTISTDGNWTCDVDGTQIHCYTDPNFEIGTTYNKDIITFQVRAPSVIGTVHNTAIVDTNTSEADYTNNTNTESTLVMEINLQVQKLVNGALSGINLWNANPTYVGIGDDINYTLRVRNEAISNVDGNSTVNIPITDINVTDILPLNITNISLTANSSRFTCNTSSPSAGSTVVCTLNNGESLLTTNGWVNVATITAKATTTFHDVTTNTPIDEAHNWITNQYQALTTLGDNIPADNAPDGGFLETNTLIRAANISIDKNGPTTIGAGQSFIYTLDVSNWPRNTNPSEEDRPSTTAQGITVTDTLPTGTTFNSASGSGWTCSGTTVITCTHADMPASSTTSRIDINVTAPNTITTLVNEANVTTTTPELTRLLDDNNDSFSTDVLGTNINVTKTGTTQAGMGDELTYTISVKNESATVPAKDVKIVDILHSGVSLDANWSRDITADWSCTDNSASSEHNVSCDYIAGDLQPGDTKSLTLYTKAPMFTGNIVNRALATTITAGDNTDTSDFSTLISGADIDFATNPFSQSPSPVGAYMPIDYNITIINKGYSEATDVNITMQFPTGFSQEFNVTSTSTGWGCTFDNGAVKLTCNLLSVLAPNDTTATLQIHALAPSANETVSYDIQVHAKDSENNTTSATLSPPPETIVKGPDLKIKKYAKDTDPLSDGLYHDTNITVGVGKFVDFNISVSNESIGLAKDIVVLDVFDARLTDLNITNSNDWNCNIDTATNSITCNRDELAPKTTAPDIILSAKTTSVLSTIPIINGADVNTTTPSDNTYGADEVTINLEGATLTATLTPSKSEVAMDESFTYDLNITNTGRNPAIDVNITDVLHNDFNYTGYTGADWTTCVDTNGTIDCTNPFIVAYGGSTILKLNVQAPSNIIGIYQNSIDINSSSIISTITVPAIPDVRVVGADLIVDINATPTDVLEDRNVTYAIGIKDINISTAYDVNLTVTFSQALNDLNITNADGGTCNVDSNTSISCSFGALAYNEDRNITLYGTMPFTDTVINALSATASVATTSTQEDIANDTAIADVTVHPIKPIANYQFEECKWTGTVEEVKDSISNLNGTAHGALTMNHLLSFDDNNFSSPGRTGLFDGSNDSITIPNNAQLQIVKNQTICMWLKPSNFSNRQNPYSKAYGGEGTITQEGSGSLTYYYGDSGYDGGSYQGFGTNTSLTLNQWNHVCIVRDLDNMQLSWYVNGINTSNTVALFSLATAGNNPVIIGDGYTNNYAGNIDEVEIYNISLDPRAVNDIYNFEINHKNYDGTVRPTTVCGVDLSVVKTAIPSGNVGAESNLTYNITVTNLSAEPVVDGFSLTDTLPTDTTYSSDSFSSNLSCIGTSDMNCTFPDTLIMKQGESETITINVTTANKDKVNITNSATATPTQPDDVPENNTGSVTNQIIGTDLKITKTVNNSLPNPGDQFIYTVRVENISTLADAQDVIITDHYDSRLSIVAGSISAIWNEAGFTPTLETLSNNTFNYKIDKLSIGNYLEFNVTMVSTNAETNLLNEANVTSSTIDTNLANNNVSISIDTNTTAGGNIPFIENLLDFRNEASINDYGNIATIGNTILSPVGSTSGLKLNEINSTHVISSSAVLDFLDTNNTNPDDNITIKYAGLFWGGHLHGNDKNETGLDIPFETITFTTPDGAAHIITADKIDNNATNRAGYYYFKKYDDNNITSEIGNYRIFYGASANITSLIQDLSNAEGTYEVTNMQATDGMDSPDWAPGAAGWERFRDYGYFGGWSMVVIYSVNHKYHREVKFKNLSSFSGYQILLPSSVTPGDPASASLPITIDKFLTPLSGDIDSSLFTFIQGGDQNLMLEGITVEDKNGIAHAVHEGSTNYHNMFNDTITLNDATGSPITKIPNNLYNVGTDIDQFNINSDYINGSTVCANEPCYLSNQQNSTKVNIEVNQSANLDGIEYPSEQAFAQMMSMETQIFTPDFIDSYKECFKLEEPLNENGNWVPCSEPSPVLRRGDKIKYRITAINTGDDYASNVYISDVLPNEITYDDNSTIVSYRYEFSSLGASVPSCSSPLYESSKIKRDDCINELKNYLIDYNTSLPTHTLSSDIIEENYYNHINYSSVDKTLVIDFDQFNKDNVAWIEFTGIINASSRLGRTFENSISIEFTNPTLAAANLPGSTVTQVSDPVESSPIYFNWDNIKILVSDTGRGTVGAKIVNDTFNLDVNLSGINTYDINDSTTTMFLDSLNIRDVYNNILDYNITNTIVDTNSGVASTDSLIWHTQGTSYNRASKELGFDMTITLFSSDSNHTETKIYPNDFNASAPYAGDVFTTRPKEFTLGLSGAATSTVNGVKYHIVTAGKTGLVMDINATDINGILTSNYNAILSKSTNDINYSADTSKQIDINATCFDPAFNDLNISDLTFVNGIASAPNIKYSEVGIIKFVVQDSNWTNRDSIVNDCNTTVSGDNNLNDDGIISCNIDINSSLVIFKPDHFTFTNTSVTNHNNFTYMVENPINDPMFATIVTTTESRNADNNITRFFSNTCFANDVNLTISYNATSKDSGALQLNIANDNNLTDISTDTNITTSDTILSTSYGSDFTNGTSPITLRIAVDRNQTIAQQPLLIDTKDLNGSIAGYLGITNADVSDLNGTNETSFTTDENLTFYYGRVHAPDYRFAGDNGDVKVFYEVYCNDCNQSDKDTYTIGGNESADSINWYINTLHTQVIDGNVSLYHSLDGVTFDTTKSVAVNNGVETIHVTAPTLPYKDKVEMNSTTWTTYKPTTFLLEFQDKQKDWAGQGNLGHIIDTNVSKRSNRRLEW